MAKKAPHFAGPDLLGGPDFDLAQHKGAYVYIAFEGYLWCANCVLQLPNLLAVAWDYALNQSVPPVHFVIVNWRNGTPAETVVTYGKQENIIMPMIADDSHKILDAYAGTPSLAFPQAFIVKPTGILCEEPSHAHTADEIQAFLINCGAPEPGGTGVRVIEWGAQPPETVAIIPSYVGWPPQFPTPVDLKPKPDPKSLSLMSRQVMRALALHDSAVSLADHAARIAVRKAALESAAAGLGRMEKANKLSAELGPLPPFAVVIDPDRKKSAEQ
jgi:AhpC/TSA family